jgi:hypothetical protein
MVSVMFLPAYRVNSTTLGRGIRRAQQHKDYYQDKTQRDEEIKICTTKLENKLRRTMETYGINNSSISVFRLMSRDLLGILYNNREEEVHGRLEIDSENYDVLYQWHQVMRVVLWGIYGFAFLSLILTVCGFLAGKSKYPILIYNAVFGFLSGIAFLVLRLVVFGKMKTAMGNALEYYLEKTFYNVDKGKMAAAFPSVGLWLGIVVAALFFLVSLVSVFLGAGDPIMACEGIWMDEVSRPVMEEQPLNILDYGYQSPRMQSAVGQVVCTRGATAGPKALYLSQDQEIYVGRSPQAHLVITDNPHLTRFHCSIRYESGRNRYLVTDRSSNGTCIRGVRLPRDVTVEAFGGTVLVMAGNTEVTLR